MHAFLERNSPVTLDSSVNSLSWRGTEKEGWLAVGNTNRVVGVTYTEISEGNGVGEEKSDGSEELEQQNLRRNFNFREHTQNVSILTHYSQQPAIQ